jgi:hypothetical protein
VEIAPPELHELTIDLLWIRPYGDAAEDEGLAGYPDGLRG